MAIPSRPDQDTSYPIAYFVTPHGFGHAARASAVMSAIYKRLPSVHFHIFTTVPQWFFEDSVKAPFSYHELLTDIGMAQSSPLEENPALTLARLDDFFPLKTDLVGKLARTLNRWACRLVICDIAPLGIAVAKSAGIVSILVENFTWDWIYTAYVDRFPAFSGHIDYLRRLFDGVDYRVQAQPVCEVAPGSRTTPPISRSAAASREETRQRLDIPSRRTVVIVTMGGVPERRHFENRLGARGDITFILPGGASREQHEGNVIRLPHRSPYFHPDLIQCADAVIGKTGYSTLAEVFHAGVPFGYVSRPAFRESPVLDRFVRAHMPGVALSVEAYGNGTWMDRLDRLLAFSPKRRVRPNGADQAAGLVTEITGGAGNGDPLWTK